MHLEYEAWQESLCIKWIPEFKRPTLLKYFWNDFHFNDAVQISNGNKVVTLMLNDPCQENECPFHLLGIIPYRNDTLQF